jgi:hypothetical protein
MAAERIEIHLEALQEFKAAIAWCRDRSEKSDREFRSRVDEAAELLLDSPQRWPFSIFQLGGLGCDGFPSLIYHEEKRVRSKLWP